MRLFGIALLSKTSQYYFTLLVTLAALGVLFRLENSRFGLVIKSLEQAENLGIGRH